MRHETALIDKLLLWVDPSNWCLPASSTIRSLSAKKGRVLMMIIKSAPASALRFERRSLSLWRRIGVYFGGYKLNFFSATAAGLISFSWRSVATPAPSHRSPTRASLGTASLSTSSLFVFTNQAMNSRARCMPPGRARLTTEPVITGSPTFVITMGMVLVALLVADAGAVPETTISSTLSEPSPPQAQPGAQRLFPPQTGTRW